MYVRNPPQVKTNICVVLQYNTYKQKETILGPAVLSPKWTLLSSKKSKG